MKTKRKTAAVTSAVIALSMVSFYPMTANESGSTSGIIYAEEAKTADGFLYVESGSDAVITGYEGTATDISIPEKIGDLTVTRIGDYAFQYKTLTSVTLPSSLTEIGDEAFYACEGLKKITIPSEVTTIGYQAFMHCKNLSTVELNDGLREIGTRAFANTSVTEISIPENVTEMDSAFSDVKTLKHAAFAGSRLEIPDRAFYFCSGLETIDFPEDLTEIGTEAFYSCDSLQKISFPSGLRTIGYQSFMFCKNLTEAELNDDLVEIDTRAFANTSLKEITIPDTVTRIDDAFSDVKTLKHAVFTGSRLEIPDRSFYFCSGLETIDFPDGLTEIGTEAFYSCDSLKKISFPSGLRTIGYQSFMFCKNLTEVELNDDLVEIDTRAFANTSLKEICIPESVTKIDDAFSYVATLKHAVFTGSRTRIPDRSFYYCSGLETIDFPESLTEIGTEAFYCCDSLKKISFPSNLKTIGYQSFMFCKNLTEAELNDGLDEISTRAFSDTALKEISIPESVAKIDSSFSDTDTMKKVEFKGKRTVIPAYAFQDCKSITEITAPAETEHIYMSAFEYCENLQTLKILNPDCVLEGNAKISDYLTIYGYENSTAQKYAVENNYKFDLLENAPVIAEPAPSPVLSSSSTPVPSTDPTTVSSPDPSSAPTPVSSPDHSPVPTSSPVPTTEPEVEVIPVEDADMNDDSVITMADYVTLIKRILTANVEYDAAFDINKDNKIDAADVITLRKVFLGTVVCE
ncbi:MAG: leucine-rich repeat protein [Oscillospiraceae bacterium]|nr:leucine-rich repeat protein [Oscillospiraceae bacterium]